MNFKSVKNKKEEIGSLIDTADPCVIIGTETWHNSGINSSEIFPANYEVKGTTEKTFMVGYF